MKKTRRQKVFAILAACLLCASFFAMPVSAAETLSEVTVSNIIYAYGADEETDQRPFSSLWFGDFPGNIVSNFNNITSNSNYWFYPDVVGSGRYDMTFEYNNLPDTYTLKQVYFVNKLFDDNVERTYVQGDTFFLESGELGFYFDTESQFTDYRFTLRDGGDDYDFSFGKVVAFTDTIPISFTIDDYGIEYDRLTFTFLDDVTSRDLCVCIEFTCASDDEDFIITFDTFDLVFKYGSGVSPSYPIFPSAPGGDDIGNYADSEQALMGSQESGLQQGLDSMTNMESTLNSFKRYFQLPRFASTLSSIMDRMIEIPGFDLLVNISIALGLFASLLSLSAAIVSAADRRAGQAKREAARAARSDKKK